MKEHWVGCGRSSKARCVWPDSKLCLVSSRHSSLVFEAPTV